MLHYLPSWALCSKLQFHSETYIKAPYGMKLSGVLNPSHKVWFWM